MLDVNGFVAPKYVAIVLDELDHYLVARILVLHCFETWSHTANRGTDEVQLSMAKILGNERKRLL